MIPFADAFIALLGSTLIPAFLGLVIITSAGKVLRKKYIMAFSLGIFLWFFIDITGDAASLDVNDGFTGGVAQVAIVGLFGIGFLFFIWADRNRRIFLPESAFGQYGTAIPFLVAGAIGMHGLGEGAAFGATVLSPSSTSLLYAFGGLPAGVAYVLHKGFEPMIIGACYWVYSKDHAKNTIGRLKDLALLSTVFVAPALIGSATGYYWAYDSTYFFALGAGTSIYAALRLAGPLFAASNGATPRDSIKTGAWLLLGFLAIYFAALFHS